MTGLLKKDFRLLANYGKAVVLMMGVFLVAAIYLKNISFSAGVNHDHEPVDDGQHH